MSTSVEMTDRDGDALTLTTTEEGFWVTCTKDGEEITVGPFETFRLPGRVTWAVGA